MNIKIIFPYSKSKNYDDVCKLCSMIGTLSQEGETKSDISNTLVIDIKDIKNNKKIFLRIISLIERWNGVSYYINDEMVFITELYNYLRILNCETAEIYDESESDNYCCSGNGWGCRQLGSINLVTDCATFYDNSTKSSYYAHSWYEYGKFNNNIWEINKEKILKILTNEAKEQKLELCGKFNLERIRKIVNSLPDTIKVTDDKDCKWEYKYREASAGSTQTEIIGVEPRRENSYDRVIRIGTEEKEENLEENNTKYIPDVSFSDIGGIDEIVQEIREVIELPLISPELFEHYHIKPHKGILLYGPPGCGKTLIAKAIAHDVNAHFIVVNGPEIFSKWVGQSEENIRNIFKEAEKFAPSVIYFDEFDSISSVRNNDITPQIAPVVNQLLTELDGVKETSKICAIASTNRPDIIDPALKRPGRFDYIIEIKPPSLEGCKEIFRIHTKNMPIESSFDKDAFAKQYLTGLTGAEISFVAAEAAYNSIRRTVNMKDALLNKSKVTISKDNIVTNDDFILAAKKIHNR